ncbi:hypothetical protein V8E36_000869 [Tilletia maclaganii]
MRWKWTVPSFRPALLAAFNLEGLGELFGLTARVDRRLTPVFEQNINRNLIVLLAPGNEAFDALGGGLSDHRTSILSLSTSSKATSTPIQPNRSHHRRTISAHRPRPRRASPDQCLAHTSSQTIPHITSPSHASVPHSFCISHNPGRITTHAFVLG